jgi:trimeric autotransporter adhesin
MEVLKCYTKFCSYTIVLCFLLVNHKSEKMKKVILSVILCFSLILANAQSVAINTDGSLADASALLDVKSSSKGMLVPRMTTAQRTVIASPATSLLVFDTTTGTFWFYNGAVWVELTNGALSGSGISNFMPKFTGPASIGNSVLEDKTDSLVLSNKNAFAKSNGSLYFRDPGGFLQFPAVTADVNTPMMYMFNAGTANRDRMVIAHSAGFPKWGLEYKDTTDALFIRHSTGRSFAFELFNGHMGVGVENPDFPIDMLGRMRIQADGNMSNSPGIWFANQANTFDRAFLGMSRPDSTIGIYSQHLGKWAIEFEVMREPRIGINTKSGGDNTIRAELHLLHTNFGGSNDGVRIQNEGSNGHYWNLYTSNTTGDFEFFKQGIKRATINLTSGTYTAISDERLKKNIRLMPSGTLSKVMSLRPTTYQFADMLSDEVGIVKGGDRYYNGFIAQEVEKIFPELVFKGSDNPAQDFYRMDYSGFGVIAIKAIQEQQQMIQQQKNEIELLKKEVEEIKKKLLN